MKKATLLFGHTTYALTSILCVFMAGLALGNFAAPSVLRRFNAPFLAYVIAEVVIAILGLSLSFAPWDRLPVLLPYKVALLCALFSPTFLMGLTVPIVVSGLREISKHRESFISKVYFVNTLGAAVGAIVGAFYLLPTYGNIGSAWIAAGLLLLAAALSIPWVGLKLPPVLIASSGFSVRDFLKSTHVIAFVFGAIGLSQEIVWTRLLSLIFGPSVYALGSVLFIYLIGIALGAALANRYREKMNDSWISWNLLFTGSTIFFGMLFFSLLPYVYLAFVGRFHVGFTALRVIEVVLGGLTLLPLAFSQGFLLPSLVIVSKGPSDQEHKVAGMIFGSNTLGCIAGAMLTSLLLIPNVGLLGCLFLSAFLSVFFFLYFVRLGKTFAPVCFTVVVLVGALSWSVWSSWDNTVLASGIYKYAVREILGGNPDVKLTLGTTKYFKEGLSSTVAVIESDTDLFLSVDGKVDASMLGDLSTQTLLAALPISFGKEDSEVLVVGLASGVTSGTALLFDQTQVTTVEIEPAVVEAQAYFTKINHDPLASRRHTLIIDDARNFLKKTNKRFDVITSEPSNPWMNGIAPLFTKEFFELAGKHLNEEGIMCQWLPIYGMTPDLVQSVIRTFATVFPDFFIFESVEGFDLLLIGSKKRLLLDPSRLVAWPPKLLAELKKANIQEPEDLLGMFLSGSGLRSRLPSSAVINTDDSGFLEYRAPKTLHLKTAEENHRMLVNFSDGIDRYVPESVSTSSKGKMTKKVFSRGDQAILGVRP